MTSTTDTETSRDGLRLQTRTWRPAAAPWARVLIVHGLSEHSGRYEAVGAWLAEAGIEAHAYDQRGFGRSAGRRGYVRHWSRLLDDLEDRLADLRAALPALPVVLYGHSLGGLLCAGYAESDRPQPDLLVLGSPALDSSHPRSLKWGAEVLGRVLPWLAPRSGGDFSVLSRDPSVGAAFRDDPLVVHTLTARFGLEAFIAQRRARSRLSRIRVPTLVVHGAEDRLVPPEASAALAELPVVERRVYPGLRHELHNEPEGGRVIGDVVAWIRARLTTGAPR